MKNGTLESYPTDWEPPNQGAIDLERIGKAPYTDAQAILPTKYTYNPTHLSGSSGSSSCTEDDVDDSNLTNFYENNPMSVDAQLTYVIKLSFWQILNQAMLRSPVIVNCFFISLAGYYGLETFENTQAMIKGVGLANILVTVLCLAMA